jgi:hypothetical protein
LSGRRGEQKALYQASPFVRSITPLKIKHLLYALIIGVKNWTETLPVQQSQRGDRTSAIDRIRFCRKIPDPL